MLDQVNVIALIIFEFLTATVTIVTIATTDDDVKQPFDYANRYAILHSIMLTITIATVTVAVIIGSCQKVNDFDVVHSATNSSTSTRYEQLIATDLTAIIIVG